MQQMVDIEVDLDGDDSDELEDESEDDLSSEEGGGSDEHMQQGMADEEVSSSTMDTRYHPAPHVTPVNATAMSAADFMASA
jgi:hypothetical protein